MAGPFRIVVSQWAVKHIHNGFSWYEEQKEGLGHQFMEEIDACLQQIAAQPTIYSQLNAKFRRAKVARFPYLIIYEIRGLLY